MSNKIATVNTYSDEGLKKARGFNDQDEALAWINENITDPKYIYWKGHAPSLQFPLNAMEFYIAIFGSLSDALIKDYSINKELVLPQEIMNREGNSIFTWGMTSLFEFLDRPQFIVAYKQL